MRRHRIFLSIFKKYAIFPVKTNDAGWVVFRNVWIVLDNRPVEYLEVLHRKKTFADEQTARDYYRKMCDLI